VDKKEFLERLLVLGWSCAEFGRRVGVSSVTVSRWGDVPGPAAAYLRLACRVRELLGEVL